MASVISVLSFFLLLGAVGLGFTAFGFASGARSLITLQKSNCTDPTCLLSHWMLKSCGGPS